MGEHLSTTGRAPEDKPHNGEGRLPHHGPWSGSAAPRSKAWQRHATSAATRHQAATCSPLPRAAASMARQCWNVAPWLLACPKGLVSKKNVKFKSYFKKCQNLKNPISRPCHLQVEATASKTKEQRDGGRKERWNGCVLKLDWVERKQGVEQTIGPNWMARH
jgi:hypothetical protein